MIPLVILSVLIWINIDINGMNHGCFLKDQPLKDNPEEGVWGCQAGIMEGRALRFS